MRDQSQSSRFLGVLAVMLTASAAIAQADVSILLTGSDADGYLATVGFNQEGNQTLAGISRDPASPKFFDYPAYVNPVLPTNVFIMYVEPYRFGLEYPDELHPTGFGVFEGVGDLRPEADAELPGVTFIEGVTEDQDFQSTNIGTLHFDAALVTGVGTEVVSPVDLVFAFDGTEFESTNRTEIIAGADILPFGPDGRSNRNEAANVVTMEASNLSGKGLTFQGGLLTAIDVVGDASINVVGAAFAGSAFGFDATGTIEITQGRFAFDIDGQDSVPFASNVRLILTRTGSIDAIKTFVVPGTCPADFNGDGVANADDVLEVVTAVDNGTLDYDASGQTDFFDVLEFLRVFDGGCQ